MPEKPRVIPSRPLLKHRQEEVRAQIQATKLVQRLQSIADGTAKVDPKLVAVQVAAAKVLLAKTLPDLSSVALTDGDGGPLKVVIQQLGEGDA